MFSLSEYLEKNIFHYNEEAFEEELLGYNDFKTPRNNLENKYHLKYLSKYFSKEEQKAEFYLTEHEYISKNYITDYSNYYSTCFEDYKRKCTRIHFFTFYSSQKGAFLNKLKQGILGRKVIVGGKKNNFWEKYYLGFIVINPIPNTFIGYTLFRHYNDFRPDKLREFWGVKRYKIHILGNEITISTLAFHEQDSNVGACATISIWTAFQIASEDYYVNLKSPVEITNDAGLINVDGQRMFPNREGLIPVAICTAVTKNKLVTEVRDFYERSNNSTSPNTNTYVKRLVNAYSGIHLPIILGIDVPENEKRVGHAVAICGHKFKEIGRKLSKDKNGISWKADYTFQIYFHDDQWGPFVRATFRNTNKLETPWSEVKTKDLSGNVEYRNIFTLDEKGVKEIKNGEINYAEVRMVIIPTFPKIRIPYEDIEHHVIGLDKLIKDAVIPLKDILLWDIKLCYSEDFKKKIRDFKISKEDNIDVKYSLVSKSLPKYIWVATLSLRGETDFISFIFDATGLINTRLLLYTYFYIPGIKKGFVNSFRNAYLKNRGMSEYFDIYEELFDKSIMEEDFFI
ncbi:MAG: hypothetical protein EHM93_06550 [Bacteroidales bacterium]|nr:MAG: hypothetical protein EHM93_06550 [Bacteroidales bacterium]